MWSVYDTLVLLTGIIVAAIAILPVAGIPAGTRLKSAAIGGGLILLALFLGSLRSFTYPSIVMGGPVIALLVLGAVVADGLKRSNPSQAGLPSDQTGTGILEASPSPTIPPALDVGEGSDPQTLTAVALAPSPSLLGEVREPDEQQNPIDTGAERSSAWLEVNDPGTTAERLSEIAAKHPEFGAQMLAHPNVYPGLREWIQQLPGDDVAVQCPACGNLSTSGDTCSLCGHPLSPDAAVGRAPSLVSPPSSAEPLQAGVKRAGSRIPFVVGIVALCLALVGTAAFAAVKLFPAGASNAGGSNVSVAAELQVTGTPPRTSPWSHGYSEAWRVNPAKIVARTDPDGGGNEGYAYAGRSEGRVAFTVNTATASGTVLAVDDSMGKRSWSTYSGEQCGGLVGGSILRCQGGRMGYYPTELVNMATGKSTETPSSQELGAKIPDGQEDVYGWSTFVIDGGLFASWLDEPSTGSGLNKLRVARLADDGSAFVWTSDRPLVTFAGADFASSSGGRFNHGIVTGRWGALNATDGTVILDGTASDQPASVQWVAQDVLQGGDQVSAPKQFTAPDGTKVSIIGVGGISVTTTALPKHPIRQTADGVAAFDPASGADSLSGPTLWSTKLGPTGSDDSILDDGTNGDYLLAYRDGMIAVARQPRDSRAGVVSMLAEDTGALLWQANVIAPAGGEERAVIVPTFTAEGELLVEATHTDSISPVEGGTSELTMFTNDNGDILWSRAGAVAGAELNALTSTPFAPEVERLNGIVVDNLDGAMTADTFSAEGTFSMLRAMAPAVTVPADAPSCPSGMTAISWTQYADGAILLCHSDAGYAVVVPAHSDWRATNLDFAGGGYQVAFDNGTRVRVALGGQVVYTDADGSATAAPAVRSWNDVTGEVKVSVPPGLPSCPAGSWPISLSTYDGGWLLVCGTSADSPTSMRLSDGSDVSDLGSVVYRNGGYCSTADGRTVCAYRSPAVVSVTEASGEVTQHGAEWNYFDGHGQGGVGKGNGSYGVESPDDNAKDQVRYLTQILEKSMAGRTSLQSAVDKVRDCSDLEGALTSFNDVLANRQELLDALESTPVDAVPNGSELVASLRNALQLSHDSDQVWLQWAQSEQANGCAEGVNSALYQQVRTMNENVATAKDAFLAIWNSQIAAAYGAPQFKTSQI